MEQEEIGLNPEALEIALNDHAVLAAHRARLKLDKNLCAENLERFLADTACIRYPTEIYFDDTGLEPPQFAEVHLKSQGSKRLCQLQIAKRFQAIPDKIYLLAAYMAAVINYGDLAAPETCELQGAALVGMSQDDFYETICKLVDSIE